jgi:hypothetical protein
VSSPGPWTDDAPVDAALLLSKAHGGLRHHDEIQRWAPEGRQSAHLAGDAETECAVWMMLVTEHARTKAARPAQRALDEAARSLARVSGPRAIEQALQGLTAAYGDMGFVLQAMDFACRALAVAEISIELLRISNAWATLLVIGGMACEALERADLGAVRVLLDEMWPLLASVRADAPRLGSLMPLARVDRLAGCLKGCEGQLVEALVAHDRLGQAADQLRDALACSAWIERGLVQRRLGLTDKARASGDAAADCNLAPLDPRTMELRRLALLADLQGDPQSALGLMRTYLARRQVLPMSALDTRVAELGVNTAGQGLRVENCSLRERSASLTTGVQQVSRKPATYPLTGPFNRRGFEAAWALYTHGGRRRMSLLADRDRFKKLNDCHSRAAGDAVPRKGATLVQRTLHGRDWLVRHGGDESGPCCWMWSRRPAAPRWSVRAARSLLSSASPGRQGWLSPAAGVWWRWGPVRGLTPARSVPTNGGMARSLQARHRVLDDSTQV